MGNRESLEKIRYGDIKIEGTIGPCKLLQEGKVWFLEEGEYKEHRVVLKRLKERNLSVHVFSDMVTGELYRKDLDYGRTFIGQIGDYYGIFTDRLKIQQRINLIAETARDFNPKIYDYMSLPIPICLYKKGTTDLYTITGQCVMNELLKILPVEYKSNGTNIELHTMGWDYPDELIVFQEFANRINGKCKIGKINALPPYNPVV